MNRKTFSITAILALLSIWSAPVMAYIDPASGSAIMAAIIGFLVAISMMIKSFWYKLKSLITKTKRSNNKETLTDLETNETDN